MPKATVTETVENDTNEEAPTNTKLAQLKNFASNPKIIAAAVASVTVGAVLGWNAIKAKDETTES